MQTVERGDGETNEKSEPAETERESEVHEEEASEQENPDPHRAEELLR